MPKMKCVFAMKAYYETLYHWITFSIHKVPWGVLVNEDMIQAFSELQEFTLISKKLGKNDNELIEKCHTLYHAWEQYRNSSGDYNSFESYLIKHDIKY